MCLHVHLAVDHVNTRPLQSARPLDVVLLIEARLQLHQHRHLLAALVGLQQRVHNRRVLPDAIERLLDGQHLRIARRRLDELRHRAERVIRVVQQQIALLHRGEEIWRAA